MLIYWEKNAGEVQEANFDIEEDDERCQLHKSHWKIMKIMNNHRSSGEHNFYFPSLKEQ
jgi:hypothetical protein